MTATIRRARWTLGLALLLCVTPMLAQEPESKDQAESAEETEAEAETEAKEAPRFGSPDQVDNQIARDQGTSSRIVRECLLARYFAWKERLQDKRGLSLSVDYSAAYVTANESPGENHAASGMMRFFGSWDLVGRKSGSTGAFVWKVEHRHAYTDLAPKQFGFNLGYIGLIEPPFSDQGLRWTNFYWRQRWKEGRIAMMAGFLDTTDFVDVYVLASPWTGFLNFAFSTGTQTLPVPEDAALGVGLGGMVTKNLFLIGSLVDRNGDPERFWDGFSTFSSNKEYFKSIEIGWTPAHGQIYLNNTHLTLWQADERVEAGEPSGWGANFSWTKYLAQKWMPFVRAGYADESGSLMQKSVSVGFGFQPDPGGDLLGIGLNWGEPNEDTWAPGLGDQYTAELFFRWQLTPQFAITPDIQYLRDPALNPDQDSIWVFGLRVRLAL